VGRRGPRSSPAVFSGILHEDETSFGRDQQRPFTRKVANAPDNVDLPGDLSGDPISDRT
jgi:hypothetical protein